MTVVRVNLTTSIFITTLLGACSLPDVAVKPSTNKGSTAESQHQERSADAGKDAATHAPSDKPKDASTPSDRPKPDAGTDTQGKPDEQPMPRAGAGAGAAGTTPSTDDDAGPADDVGHVFAAWPMPDAFPGSQTQPSYGTRNGVVIDTITRLEWQAELPQTYTGCTGMHPNGAPGDCCTWVEAAAYCESFGEARAEPRWRVPTKIELESVLDETKNAPAIDAFYFPNTPNHAFWTSTLFSGAKGNAYNVGFGTGLTAYGETRFKADVRCVR